MAPHTHRPHVLDLQRAVTLHNVQRPQPLALGPPRVAQQLEAVDDVRLGQLRRSGMGGARAPRGGDGCGAPRLGIACRRGGRGGGRCFAPVCCVMLC